MLPSRGSILLVVAIVSSTGSALAGNGNGNGQAESTPTVSATDSASQAPGNSANAPAQVKKTSTASTTQSSGGGGGGATQNSTLTQGMKATNGTSHDTNCTLMSTGCTPTGANATTLGVGDASKRYGSGTTVAEVARASGVTSAKVHGPGNSQPHKIAPDSEGVLAASARGGRSASLPFTGAPLWLAFLAGLLLLVTGLGLRQIRTAEATVGIRHDHPNRPRHAARSSRSSVGGRASR